MPLVGINDAIIACSAIHCSYARHNKLIPPDNVRSSSIVPSAISSAYFFLTVYEAKLIEQNGVATINKTCKLNYILQLHWLILDEVLVVLQYVL